MLGSCWAMLGWCWALIEPYWVYLGSFGSDKGQLLGSFYRAKNIKKYVIFSVKKLGLEGFMLGSCGAFTGPCWGYLGPWLSHIGSISGPTIGCGTMCRWEENTPWVSSSPDCNFLELFKQPSLSSSGFSLQGSNWIGKWGEISEPFSKACWSLNFTFFRGLTFHWEVVWCYFWYHLKL